LAFATSGTQRLVIDSSGQIGIGTSSPARNCEIAGGASGAETILLQLRSNFTANNTSSVLRFGNSTASDTVTGSSEIVGARGSTGSSLAFRTQSGASLNEALRIDSSGNVGIGTTSPRALVDFGPGSGDGTLSQTLSQYQAVFEAPQGTGDIGRNIAFATTTTGISAAINAADEGGASATGIAFATGTAGSISERLRIDRNGNVGIGTTSPGDYLASAHQLVISDAASTGLTIATPTSSSGTIAFADGTGAADNARGLIRYGHSDNSLQFSTNAAERMRIDSSGRLLVGASSASLSNSLVEIEGSSNANFLSILNNSASDADGNRYSKLLFRGTHSGGGQATLCSVQSAHDGSANDEKGRLTLHTNDGNDSDAPTERMRIDSSGNVGIGVTSPSCELEIGGNGHIHLADQGRVGCNSGSGNPENAYIKFFDTNIVTINTTDIERMRIDSSGRLLVGTSSTATAGKAQYSLLQVEGNTFSGSNNAILGLARGTAAASISTSDSLGVITFTDNAGNEFGEIQCAADATPGASDYPGRITFSTTADGASSPTEQMRIDSSGNVLFAKTSTGLQNDGFEIGAVGGGRQLSLTQSGNGVPAMYINSRYGSGTQSAIQFYFGTSHVGSINVTSTATAYVTSSDYRLKENVVDIADGIDRVKQLQPRRFNFIADADATVDGFLAHEAQTVVPEAITGTHNEVDDDNNPVYQGIDQSKLVPLLTAALQEAIAKIETLETKVAALEAQ
jgi:hypothetical protein